MPVYEALDFFGEFDYSHHYPTNLGHDYDLIQFFVGFRFYPFNRGFYTMIGVGQSWNSNDDDKFWIKQVQTHFNWGLHAALGYRFGLTDDMDLMIEVRFSHWSNGSFTGDRNYGLNDLLLGASVLFK
jgi:opacity protein-like surface antigen